MSTARRRLRSPRSLSGTSTHPTMVTQRSIWWSWMDDSHLFHSVPIGHPIPGIRLFQTLTLKLEGQCHGCSQRTRSYGRPSILFNRFFYISYQSDQQFPRNSYFEIWPWKFQSQGHGWGQRSRSHSIHSIQLMHFLFVSHQSEQPFLRYGQKECLTLKFFKRKFAKKQFPT